MSETMLIQASAVAIDGRALLIEGAPGAGKSSLALALMDRGAQLIGDDGVSLDRVDDRIIASPPPNIAGLIEVRGVGLISRPTAGPAPVALILALSDESERLPDGLATRDILGVKVPILAFTPGNIAPAIRAEIALAQHGI